MQYSRLELHHDSADEPVEIFCESDEQSMETRKVGRFLGGLLGYADAHGSAGPTELYCEPLPDLDEIAEIPEFSVGWITRDDFERVWEAAQSAHRAGSTD